jgi:hypothetical protein
MKAHRGGPSCLTVRSGSRVPEEKPVAPPQVVSGNARETACLQSILEHSISTPMNMNKNEQVSGEALPRITISDAELHRRAEAGPEPTAGPPGPSPDAPDLEPNAAEEAPPNEAPPNEAPPNEAPAVHAPLSFPLEVLPDSIRDLVSYMVEVAEAEAPTVAMPLLVACMGTIGNGAIGRIGAAWTEPLAAFSVVLAESGEGKTSGIGLLKDILAAVQRRLPASEDGGCERIFTTEATASGVISLINSNPRGVVVVRDELSGFFERLGSGKGVGAEAIWLHCTDGQPFTVDRNSRYGSDSLERLLASVIGAVPPEIYAAAMRRNGRLSSGMASRFWCVRMPLKIRRYERKAAEIVGRRDALIERLVRTLTWLRTMPLEDEDPIAVDFTIEAEDRLREFARMQDELRYCLPKGSIEKAMRGKARGWAARLATTIRLVRLAQQESAREDTLKCMPTVNVELCDVEPAVKLIKWQLQENRAALSEMALESDDHELARLEELASTAIVDRTAGSVTVRLVARKHGLTSENASKVLDRLVEQGRWEAYYTKPGPGGGRPSRHYRRRAAPRHGT